MHKIFLFLLWSFSLYSSTFTFQGQENTKLFPYYTYTSVSSISDTPLNLKTKQWYKNLDNVPTEGVENAFWIKITVQNKSNDNVKLFLHSERSYIYSIDFYLLEQSKIIDHRSESYFENKNDSTIDNVTHRVFPLNMDKNKTFTIYFKVQSFNKINSLFTLSTNSYLSSYSIIYNLFQGFFFGVMIIMILYNLSLYFMLKFKPYLYYVFYVSSLTIYIGSYFGYLNLYTSIPTLYIHIWTDFFLSLFLILIASFLKEIFNFQHSLYRLTKIIDYIKIYIFLSSLALMIAIFYQNFSYAQLFSDLFRLSLPLLYILVFYSLFYISYRKNNKLAIYYAYLWAILGLVGLLEIFTQLNFLPIDSGFDYMFEMGMIFETVIFSLMLAHRLKEIEKEKEEQKNLLIHQNKLASMGEMISLIAHQWRQPLSEINGIVLDIDIDFRKKRLEEENLNQYLNSIEDVTAHLSKTIHDFMQLSSPEKLLESFSIKELIMKSRQMLKSSVLTSFDLDYKEINNEFFRNKFLGYKSEFIQALLIIFNNAIDACQEKGIVPKIEIVVSFSDKYLYLEIEDNGGGVEESILENIYNPYFTTKHKSQGTGLGLYILKMIVEKSMQGSVEIKNGKRGVVCILKILLSEENH